MINYLLAAIEWSDIADAFYVVVGAILGVMSSMLISWLAKISGILKLKRMLRMELEAITEGVKQNVNSAGEIVFPSPIWNFLGQTSTLLDLKASDYKKVVAIHGAIIALRDSETDISKRGPAARRAFIDTIEKNKF